MPTPSYLIPSLPLALDLETPDIFRLSIKANKKLAELKGIAHTIPNEGILINTLTLQEAKDSSEVENIVTTQDDIYRADLNLEGRDKLIASQKEVLDYREALVAGYDDVRSSRLLTINSIKKIQRHLEHNSAGFRSVPGTVLKKDDGEIIYVPPQDINEINQLMADLERFINDSEMSELDPLVKTAIIHHQFESIHPFFDGNGRTGRIIVVLYLVVSELLDLPILYLSRFITHNKGEYYRLIQLIRDNQGNNQEDWRNWIRFILQGIEETASDTILLINGISQLMQEYKVEMRKVLGKHYSNDLLNNLFNHPYTKVEFVQADLMVTRQTASKRLETLVEAQLLEKVKFGKSNYYINIKLVDLFVNFQGR